VGLGQLAIVAEVKCYTVLVTWFMLKTSYLISEATMLCFSTKQKKSTLENLVSMTGFFFNETLPTFSLLTCYIIQSLIMFESFNIHMHVKTAKGKRATGQRIEKSRKIRAISELQLSFKFPVHTWRPASFTFISAYFSCSSDRVMPVYLHPVRWTASMAKVPQPQPISRISWSLLILA